MKSKLLLTFLFISCFSSFLSAQISKSAYLWGGDLYFNRSEVSTDDPANTNKNYTTHFGGSPSLGIVVKDNLVAGISLRYASHRNDNDINDYFKKSRTYGGGFFIRKYLPVLSRFYIFGEGSLGTDWTRGNTYFNNNTNSFENDSWNVSLAIHPGISYAVSPKILLDAGFNNLFSIQYGGSSNTTINNPAGNVFIDRTKYFNAGFNLQDLADFSVGIRFLANRR